MTEKHYASLLCGRRRCYVSASQVLSLCVTTLVPELTAYFFSKVCNQFTDVLPYSLINEITICSPVR